MAKKMLERVADVVNGAKQVVVETFSPEERYRRLVREAADSDGPADPPDTKLLIAVSRAVPFFHADVKLLKSRRQSARDIQEADRLEREARAMPIDDPDTISAKPLKDFATLGELVAAIQEVQFRRDPSYRNAKKVRQHEMLTEANMARGEARGWLYRTADPAIGKEVQEKRKQINDLQTAIVNRQKLAMIEERIEATHEELEELAQGRNPMPSSGDYGESQQSRCNRIRLLRKRLDELNASLPHAEAAREQNAADEEKIARLEAECRELEAMKYDPERMNWSPNR